MRIVRAHGWRDTSANNIRWIVLCIVLLFAAKVSAQVPIVTVRPDQVAPGMTAVIEVLTTANRLNAFGTDGITPGGLTIQLMTPKDSDRVMIGPLQVSWSGRLIQIPVLVSPSSILGSVLFRVVTPTGNSTVDSFKIVQPQHLGRLSGDLTLGDVGIGVLSRYNTIVVDSLIVSSANIQFSTESQSSAANPRLQPITILSRGPIRISNSTISVDADSLNGGPGGGGGGHGHAGVGGQGYTGGGNSSAGPDGNVGSGTAAKDSSGGASLTGVNGGGSENSDQGGGGGTGAPFGTSGAPGAESDSSHLGGYGGGSGGGELAPQIRAYGGGGGGFGLDGQAGFGVGRNQGFKNGGRFLIPFAGGSGGGAGNALNDQPGAGSGGGGGGAIALVTFDSLVADESAITARGDSGTSGVALTAGGGGGSGGALYLAAARGANGTVLDLLTDGGKGGDAGQSGSRGGAGSLGRFRLDGPLDNNCLQCKLSAIQSAGISLTPVLGLQSTGFVQLHGSANDPFNTTDSVRIYYRSHHTGWQFVDTVRYLVGTHHVWSKWIPLAHDSLIYAVAMIQVSIPDKSFANDEPAWIVSHVSQTIVHHVPSSNLVLSDTLLLDTTTVGHCTTKWLHYSNLGESALTINSQKVTGSSNFNVLTALPVTIPAYASDSILVQFCPDALGRSEALLDLNANDNALHHITLIGVGAKRNDSLLVVTSPLDMGRVFRGACDTASVFIRAAGRDTVYLNFAAFSNPPFTFELIPADTILAPGDTARVRVSFCPPDTGSYSRTVSLGPKNLLTVSGIGISRALRVSGPLDLGDRCIGQTINFLDTVSNLGTDTIKVSVISSSADLSLLSPLPTNIISGGANIIYEWSVATSTAGDLLDTIFYRASDTLLSRVVRAHAVHPFVVVDSELSFHFTCSGSCDTLALVIRNTGDDSIRIDQLQLVNAAAFTLAGNIGILPPHSDTSIRIAYCPQKEEESTDALHFRVTAKACDTTYSIAVTGAGTALPLVVNDLRFDTTFVGGCTEDSLLLENPCGPQVTISSIALPHFVQVLSGELPLSIPSRGRAYLHFTFCPDAIGEADSAMRLFTSDTSFVGNLSGFGKAVVSTKPAAYFSLTSRDLVADSIAATVLVLDSSTIRGVHPIRVTLTYDPSVVIAQNSRPLLGAEAPAGTYTLSGSMDFSVLGTKDSIYWLGLLGGKSATVTALLVEALDSSGTIFNRNGSITILDCSSLAGKVSIAGPYGISITSPNPATSFITAEVELGNDGEGVIEICDIRGSRVLTLAHGNLKRGRYTLRQPLEGLANGAYIVRLQSLGFVQSRMFLLRK